MVLLQILAIAVVLVGSYIRFKINKRRFNRRNVVGIETFSSYEKAKLTQYGEGLAMFMSWLLIIVGILLFIMIHFGQHK